jgi:alkylation response protein AidB-like acyl-CoA dehydrogenase
MQFLQVFSSEQALYCTTEAIQIMGGAGFMKDLPYERYYRDAKILTIFEVCVLSFSLIF